MTKNDLVKELSKNTGIQRADVEATIETFMQTVVEQIVNKKKVSFHGFGTFSSKKRGAKTARNISKNEAIYLPAYFAPIFRPSKQFSTKLEKKAD